MSMNKVEQEEQEESNYCEWDRKQIWASTVVLYYYHMYMNIVHLQVVLPICR